MGVRRGEQFIEGLRANRDQRDIWIRGEKVADVTTHPVFAKPLKQIAKIYDLQFDPAYRDILTYRSQTSGNAVATAFMPASNYTDLVKRREAYRILAGASFGLMGRSPEYMNATLLAFAEARALFDRAGTEYGDRVVAYYEYCRENDLFLSHSVIPPQNDRSKTSSEQTGQAAHLRAVSQNKDGILVRGARMLATMGPLADELLIYSHPVLKPGDEDHALVFAVQADAPGLRQICREPYDLGDRSDYDHPLASNFEECDSMLIFNDVFVPWERVFVFRDVGISNGVFPEGGLRAHTAHQTNTRAWVKLEFATALAASLAKCIGADGFLHVQQMLGTCIAHTELMKSSLVRAEVEHEPSGSSHVRPGIAPLVTARAMMSAVFYPHIVETIQKIGAGGLFMMPSSADFGVDEIAREISRYYGGANGIEAVDRIRLFKLAWDLVGETFGARQSLYERYFAGDPVRVFAGFYTGRKDQQADAQVNEALAIAGHPMPSADAPTTLHAVA